MQTYKKILLATALIVAWSLQAQVQDNKVDAIDNKLYDLKKDLEIAKIKEDTSQIANLNIKLGDFFKELELYSEAIKNYQAYQELNKTNDTSLVYVLNALASINLDLKKFSEAQKYSRKGLQISEDIHYSKGIAQANALLGSIEEKQQHYDDALRFQKISLSIFQKLNDSTGLAQVYENIGSVYEDLEEYNVAYQHFKMAHAFAKSSEGDLQINIINNLGDVNRKTENYSKALNYTNQALQLAQQTENESQIESALKDLARTHADLGDFEKAYAFLNNQSIVNEEELMQRNAEMVSAMQVLYEVKEKEAELELLNKENQINTVRQYIIIIITGTIILALLFGLFYWNKRRRHEKYIMAYQQQLLQADLDKKTVEEAALKREIDIKISSLTNYSLHIAHKNKMLSDVSKTLTKLKGRNSELVTTKLQELSEEIESDLNNNNEWTELMGYFGQIHPGFFKSLKSVAAEKLSASEMKLCMLLRLNLSSKEIAEILRITSDSVRIARYRLRKKLPLNSKDDLQAYLLNL